MLLSLLGDAGDNQVTMTELVPPLMAIPVYQRINNHKLFSRNGNTCHEASRSSGSYSRGFGDRGGGIREGSMLKDGPGISGVK